MVLNGFIGCYKSLNGVRGCYMVLQAVTGCYMVLDGVIHVVRGCYTVLQGVTWCYTVLEGLTGCYILLQRKSLLFVWFWAARGFCRRVLNSRICQYCDVKTNNMTPLFIFFFISFLTFQISVPSFIYNLC